MATFTVMSALHDLIEAHGKDAALAAGLQRPLVEAAASYLSDEDGSVGFLYSGWCQAALPHKRLPDDATWQIEGDPVALLVEPGRRMVPGQGPEWVGIPYGSRARLILLYLQSEALRTGQREVELGRSLRAWLTRMGISIGGKSMAQVRDQAERISRCRMTFHVRTGAGRAGLVNQTIVDQALFIDTPEDGGTAKLVERVELSEKFFAQLQRHPVPLEDAAIRAISNNSMALDIYVWLAYRLRILQQPLFISWAALRAQFGTAFLSRPRAFRQTFLTNLRLATAVYRSARIEPGDGGLVLHPSPPPVAPRPTSRRRLSVIEPGK